jgi:hypothetical protein
MNELFSEAILQTFCISPGQSSWTFGKTREEKYGTKEKHSLRLNAGK